MESCTISSFFFLLLLVFYVFNACTFLPSGIPVEMRKKRKKPNRRQRNLAYFIHVCTKSGTLFSKAKKAKKSQIKFEKLVSKSGCASENEHKQQHQPAAWLTEGK